MSLWVDAWVYICVYRGVIRYVWKYMHNIPIWTELRAIFLTSPRVSIIYFLYSQMQQERWRMDIYRRKHFPFYSANSSLLGNSMGKKKIKIYCSLSLWSSYLSFYTPHVFLVQGHILYLFCSCSILILDYGVQCKWVTN